MRPHALDGARIGQVEAALRIRIDELEEEVRQLKSAFAPKIGFPKAWGLDPRESTILSALFTSRGSYVTIEALLLRIAGFDSDQDDSHVRLWVGRLRRKVEPLGVAIATRRDQGYVLVPEGRAVVARALGQPVAPGPAPVVSSPPAHPRGWSEAETTIVAAGYRRGTTLAVIRAELIAAGHRARSLGSISAHAALTGAGSLRKAALWSADEDAIVRAGYDEGVLVNLIRRRLAEVGFRRGANAIRMRAIALGISGQRLRPWQEREAAIARAGLAAGKRHRIILADLREAGFERGTNSLTRFAQRHNLVRGADPWSEAEIAQLRALYPDRPVRAVAEALGKSHAAVATMASKLGLKQRRAWTENERCQLLTASETGGRLIDTAARLGRPYANVAAEAARMGLYFRRSRRLPQAAE